MHVVFDYSIAPRPYPVLFFSNGQGMENERRRTLDRLLGNEASGAQRRSKPELHIEVLRRPEEFEVVRPNHRLGGQYRGSEQFRQRITLDKTLRNSRLTERAPSATNSPVLDAFSESESTGVILVSELGGASSESLPLIPSPTAQVPRAGSDRVDLSYVRPPPSHSQSQVALDWPGEAPPRYREVL